MARGDGVEMARTRRGGRWRVGWEGLGVASPTTMIVPEENSSSHRRIGGYGYGESRVKSVANNSNPVKAKVENRLKDGVRAAEGCGVRVEIQRRAVGDPAIIADARRLGHLVGLTSEKNGWCQAECPEDERDRRSVFGCAKVGSVRRRPPRLGDLRRHSLPLAERWIIRRYQSGDVRKVGLNHCFSVIPSTYSCTRTNWPLIFRVPRLLTIPG